MPTKAELIRVVRKGNFSANRNGSELACNSCGCYDWTCKHGKNCPVGALLRLIEESDLE